MVGIVPVNRLSFGLPQESAEGKGSVMPRGRLCNSLPLLSRGSSAARAARSRAHSIRMKYVPVHNVPRRRYYFPLRCFDFSGFVTRQSSSDTSIFDG